MARSTRQGIPRRGQARCLPGPRRVPRSPPTGPRGLPGIETLRGDYCWPRNGKIRARSNTATARSISSSSSRVMQPGQTNPRVRGSRSHPLDAAGLGALHRSHEVAGCDGNMVNSGYRGNELPGLINVGWTQLTREDRMQVTVEDVPQVPVGNRGILIRMRADQGTISASSGLAEQSPLGQRVGAREERGDHVCKRVRGLPQPDSKLRHYPQIDPARHRPASHALRRGCCTDGRPASV